MKLQRHEYADIKFEMVDDQKWYYFSVLFEADEGVFSFLILATSWEHAAAMISDIKSSALLDGAICQDQ